MDGRLMDALARALEIMGKATGGDQHKAAVQRMADALGAGDHDAALVEYDAVIAALKDANRGSWCSTA